ncbi:HlyD family efflux transporter periplasmic adaptor subunit [Thalassomonas actiniarum]|uniref:HlyD family efflux transporter periplasmic adaptor subunit n=1 Tax=Thalassomonas actiniarum TaxID=485447 RepID=A0AAF0C1G9_9GAMM|nr:HlyD family efflux transporter periplasmic adaptor subunit [Thalassomonas actiniarum]WDD98976.1 HlyD family efflux transporter periplasmic adaptor subunit [Thalassomonas actiniarum]
MDNLFRPEVLEKKRHRLDGAVSLVQPPLFKSFALLMVFIVFISLVYLSIGSYTRKERVSGMLQPDSGLVKLTAPQSGIITQLLVQEGQAVQKDQPLLRITSEKHGAEGFELNQSLINQYQFQITTLEQQKSKQQTQHQLQITELENKFSNFKKRLQQLDLQKDIFDKRIAINKEIVLQVSTLAGTGYISDLELKKQKDSLLSLDQQASGIRSERLSINDQIEQIENQLAQLPIEQAKLNNQINTQLAETRVQLATIKQQRLGELRAPSDGIVSGLLAKTGKSVLTNQSLLNILPDGSAMQAVIYVPTSAFGFINSGQKTRLRYHAFPYEKFGIYDGTISEISTSVILPDELDTPGLINQPSYRVVVDLAQQNINAYGKEISLRSGMMLDADIIIEERSLLHWLFDPVLSIKGQL